MPRGLIDYDQIQRGGVAIKTTNYTAVDSDAWKQLAFQPSGSPIVNLTCTLPSTPPVFGSPAVALWWIRISNIGGGSVIIARNGKLIDGVASNVTIGLNQSVVIYTDGSNYFSDRGCNPLLQVNGTNNGLQSTLNLKAGSNVTLTDDGAGGVTIASSGGGGGAANVTAVAITNYPIAANFTWQNQGTATVSGGSSSPMLMQIAASAADSLKIQEIAAPATPYSITAYMDINFRFNNFAWAGLIIRDSSTGKLVSFGFTMQNQILFSYDKWNSVTSFNSQVTLSDFDGSLPGPLPRVLKVRDDGTNFVFSVSWDKVNFITLQTISRTDFLTTPDHIGWYGNSRNSWPVYVNLWLWEQGA